MPSIASKHSSIPKIEEEDIKPEVKIEEVDVAIKEEEDEIMPNSKVPQFDYGSQG